MVGAFGVACAKKLRRRLAVLEAAQTLRQVPTIRPERCHPLHGDRRGQFAVDVEHPFRLVFQPAEPDVCRRPDGGVDLDRVTAVCILDVEDYHR